VRNQTLGQLKATLRSELRQSANPAVAQSADHILVNAIKQAQSFIHTMHSWPHMRARRDIALEAGSYKYDWPVEMDYENVEKILTKYGDRWKDVTLFTDDDETYNAYDTDSDVRADPVLRYRIIDDKQLEVWPIPLTAGILRVKGLRRPPELSGDAVQCPFDDGLVAKIAAGRVARGKGEREAHMQDAMVLFNRLTGKASTATSFHIGGRRATGVDRMPRELVVRVVRQ